MTKHVELNGKVYSIHSDRHIERRDVYRPKFAASYVRYVTLNPDSKQAQQVIQEANK